MDNTTESMNIEIEVSSIVSDFLLGLDEVIESITCIYNAIENCDTNLTAPLPTDNFPIKIEKLKKDRNKVDIKKVTINWVIKKGFEDLIVSMSAGLNQAYFFAKMFSLSRQDNSKKTREEVEEHIVRIKHKASSASFPELIEEFEKEMNIKLPYKD